MGSSDRSKLSFYSHTLSLKTNILSPQSRQAGQVKACARSYVELSILLKTQERNKLQALFHLTPSETFKLMSASAWECQLTECCWWLLVPPPTLSFTEWVVLRCGSFHPTCRCNTMREGWTANARAHTPTRTHTHTSCRGLNSWTTCTEM